MAANSLVSELNAYVDRAVAINSGSTKARKPSHRVKFHWPPHPISYSFHVVASDWTGQACFEAHGERFWVKVARTPFGVFGKCDEIWHEDRGDTEEQMLENLRASSEPLFQRQLAINRALELPGRFRGHMRDLQPLDCLKLLYCENRDIANESKMLIESHASNTEFFPALIAILRDRWHPNRRSAQWCVLDLFEDLLSFARNEDDQRQATDAIKSMIWDAEDDYARAIYKAGVVLGGHVPPALGGPVLLECLNAPSKIGRRSAIHGLFHIVEWVPETKDDIVASLRKVAQSDPEPLLRQYALLMSNDIEAGEMDHAQEPLFPDEH